jgi:hypothetical protein
MCGEVDAGACEAGPSVANMGCSVAASPFCGSLSWQTSLGVTGWWYFSLGSLLPLLVGIMLVAFVVWRRIESPIRTWSLHAQHPPALPVDVQRMMARVAADEENGAGLPDGDFGDSAEDVAQRRAFVASVRAARAAMASQALPHGTESGAATAAAGSPVRPAGVSGTLALFGKSRVCCFVTFSNSHTSGCTGSDSYVHQ